MTLASEFAHQIARRPDAAWHVDQIETALAGYHLQCKEFPEEKREAAAVLRARLREDTETAEQHERGAR